MPPRAPTSCPHCHRVTQTVLLSVSVSIAPLGLKRLPLRAIYSYSRPPPASGLAGLSRGSWPWSRRCRRRRLRFASLRCRFRSLCSLHLHSGRLRSSTAESRRCSLDAPRRVSTLACASGIPPALQKVSFVLLSCVLILARVRTSLSLLMRTYAFTGCATGFMPRLRDRTGS